MSWSNCLKLNWKAAFMAIQYSKNHNIIRNYLIYHSIQGMIFDSRVGIYISVLYTDNKRSTQPSIYLIQGFSFNGQRGVLVLNNK
jgi:hypothetical protein